MAHNLQKSANSGRIDYLDGVRAISVFLVMNYHFWQESWLQNLFPRDLLAVFGVRDFSLSWVSRTGYMYVDVMLLLSGFCLFLPYARQMTGGGAPDSLAVYFKKRAARILPSYYFCLLIFLLFFVRLSDYVNLGAYFKDFITHLTFTHNFFPDTYLGTKFPGVLWTLAVEVQFYLIFPFIARAFQRFPLQTWAVMRLLAEVFIRFWAMTPTGSNAMLLNQLPAMLGVYADGMLAAVLFCKLQKRVQAVDKLRVPLLATLVFCTAFGAAMCLLHDGLSTASTAQNAQLALRGPFSALVAVMLLALNYVIKPLRFLFGNQLFGFFAAISYNLYIWHQAAARLLKAWHIPPYPAAPADAHSWPHSASGEAWHGTWQVTYTVLVWAAAILLAAALTYCLERPIAKRILNCKTT